LGLGLFQGRSLPSWPVIDIEPLLHCTLMYPKLINCFYIACVCRPLDIFCIHSLSWLGLLGWRMYVVFPYGYISFITIVHYHAIYHILILKFSHIYILKFHPQNYFLGNKYELVGWGQGLNSKYVCYIAIGHLLVQT
jgi:hypothetical protein